MDRRSPKDFGQHALLVVWSALIFGVLGWIVYSAFKNNLDIYQRPWGFPDPVTIGNFHYAWVEASMSLYFFNSIVIVISAIVMNILIAAMAAYVLARFRFRLSKAILSFFVFGMAIPYQMVMIPLFVQVMNLGLVGSRAGLAIVYTSLWLPFSVFVLFGFFRTIPLELEDSAVMDGCSESMLYWKIMFPLARPGVIAVAVFNFVLMWNEYLLALVFITRRTQRTISLAMYSLKDAMMYESNWGGLFAAVVIMLIPTIIVFLTLQKFIIKGLTLGALKG